MKVLTWNINGIRASKISLEKLFTSLDADVICLQETKVTRDQLDEPSAIVEGYNSYFSFSKKRSGYSGVAIFCKNTFTPVKAEEGLTGLLTSDEEQSIGGYGDLSEFSTEELESLDAEGRAVITQFDISIGDGEASRLAIINVYVPRVDPTREDRHLYKLQFLALLQSRAESLLQNGSHVIVLGDMNITHKGIDHCEGESEEFTRKPSRMWLNQFVWERDQDKDILKITDEDSMPCMTSSLKGGLFADTFRYFYPDKKEAYTNWCTLTNARQTNYGQRLDYIFVNTSLIDNCLVSCEIMPDFEGSDHCPVVADFKCVVSSPKKCPLMCTKYFPEFTGKQQKLSSFFLAGKKDTVKSKSETHINSGSDSLSSSQESTESTDSHKNRVPEFFMKKRSAEESVSSDAKKPKLEKKRTLDSGKQASLSSFFVKKSQAQPSQEVNNIKDGVKTDSQHNSIEVTSKYFKEEKNNSNIQNETKHEKSNSDCIESEVKPKESKNAWKALLSGPPPPPKCKGHKEPCVLRTVKKEGPTKGKQFYVCARGEGHSSNPEARCDHFQWVLYKK